MEEFLKLESEKLTRCWMQHDDATLRDYLVAGVEDPRLNLQSVWSRHFLVRSLTAGRFAPLMDQECRFAAVMNWLVNLNQSLNQAAEFDSLLYALKHAADNAEGIEIPRFVLQTFAALPAMVPAMEAGDFTVPNYIESFLLGAALAGGEKKLCEPGLDTFLELWRRALTSASPNSFCCSSAAAQEVSITNPHSPLSVLEPACGSANDYRFLHSYGIAQFLDYTGFDLCAKNIQNACLLFPDIRFKVGNAFEIDAPDKSFDVCFVHDLFEHLSLGAMNIAAKEICRVTRQGLCVGFFQMDEIPEHRVRPVRDYYWNLLSMARMKALFAAHGFAARVLHVGSFLRQQFGCEHTHNPNAYTFVRRRS